MEQRGKKALGENLAADWKQRLAKNEKLKSRKESKEEANIEKVPWGQSMRDGGAVKERDQSIERERLQVKINH